MKWLYKVIISDITKPYEDREYVTDEEAKQVAKQVAERIRQSEVFRDHRFKAELKAIAAKFEEDVEDQGDLDSVLDELYDFGDTNAIWIDNLPISST
jgi:hypothetical protein